MIKLTFAVLVVVALGCGDDETTTDTGPAADTGMLGCASPDAAVACPGGQICCSGVPYPTEGVCMADCPAVSDRHAKHDIESVDDREILSRLASLPIAEWSYRDEVGGVRHVGPMAQDFHREFGLGADDRHIHPVDAAGITMAAVQALLERVESLERDNTALREEAIRLRERVDGLDPAR